MSAYDKERLLRVRDYIKTSDEETGFTISALQEDLCRNGISANKTTLYRDFDTLRERFGMEITGKKGSKKWYYSNRYFSYDELVLIRESINNANFLSEDEVKTLIHKISTLGSAEQAERLISADIKTFHRHKTEGEILAKIEKIKDAIEHNLKISCEYPEAVGIDLLTHKPNFAFKKLIISPFELFLRDGIYSLVATRDNELYFYNINRAKNIRILYDQRRDGRAEYVRYMKNNRKAKADHPEEYYTLHISVKEKDFDKAQKIMPPDASYYHNIKGTIDIYAKTRFADVAFQFFAGLLSLDDAKILGDDKAIDAYKEYIKRLNNLLPEE